MRLYTILSKIKFLDKSYSLKYMFISFLGIHIPLIGIITFVLISGIKTMSAGLVIAYVLAFTLVACGITLWVQNALASPIIATKNALLNYLGNKALPELPVHFKDEAGILMSNTSLVLQNLDKLIKEKRDFIYLLSHDLKTPLHNVMTLLQLIQDDTRNDYKAKHVHLIQQSTRHQIKMISTVLDLATSEFADLSDRKLVHLAPIMNRIIKELDISLKSKEIQMLVDIPYDMQAEVNEDLFSMALTNLVTNAIKFSKRNSDIMVRALDMKTHIMIRVVDYGMGFSPSQEPSFEPFHKSNHLQTEGEESNGLGLYFAKKIINYHGGTLIAESEGEGKGAKFIIKLPRTAKLYTAFI